VSTDLPHTVWDDEEEAREAALAGDVLGSDVDDEIAAEGDEEPPRA